MHPNDPRLRGRGNDGLPIDALQRAFRVAGLGAGLILLVIGMFCMLRVFGGVYDALTQPQNLESAVGRWNQLIEGSQLVIKIEEESIRLGKLISVIVMGVGALILGSLSGMMITTGMKLILASLDDPAILRKILDRLKSVNLETKPMGRPSEVGNTNEHEESPR